jgi:hypothetical protein
MGNRPGFHKSDKRRKEIARQQKQEEKKLRRLNKAGAAGQEVSGTDLDGSAAEGGTETQETQ